jgi:hypothetical protein
VGCPATHTQTSGFYGPRRVVRYFLIAEKMGAKKMGAQKFFLTKIYIRVYTNSEVILYADRETFYKWQKPGSATAKRISFYGR